MPEEVVRAPAALLLNPDLTVSAKLVWMASRLQTVLRQPGSTALCAATGLSRPTVLTALLRLSAAGWALDQPVAKSPPSEATVAFPATLLTNHRLSAQARVLYGILLLTPGFSHPCGHFTYAELARFAHASVTTLTQAINELTRAEWITTDRPNRLARIHFELTMPGISEALNDVARAQLRIQNQHIGEGLMREYLSLLVDSDQYIDNARPPFLTRPVTEVPLELDRYYYTAQVGFEFNGPQHDRPTERFDAEKVAAQRERDYIKMGLCWEKGIPLVIVRPPELTLASMQEKVGALLPRRTLTGKDLLIDYLETESRSYRSWAAKL